MSTGDSQYGLFEEIADKAIYELPVTERIRNFLRLEFLFDLVKYSMDKTSEWESRQCISSLIDISELLTRTDIKGELSKELDKHITLLQALQKNPQVDNAVLNDMLTRLQEAHRQLNNPSHHPGHALRHDELIATIRQRLSIAGGTCSFDLPAYHHWLSRSSSERKFQLNRWAYDLEQISNAIRLVLIILRTGAETTEEKALDGFFQYSLDQNRPAQLVRILLPIGVSYFPEISGGRHRFSVRFLEQPNTQERPSQVKRMLEFELQCCN